ncbi:hypothetical protein ANCCAN_12158 [Ancylostoma caninum]|uniref:Uncharacterized protein n=1 Tax=Ancylostoma caninum TaxID=29170 RepID=A0A368GFV6_ANCCA|nr:hypothetical protein ANCCAN_12158 [Ancylostoma caninum]
MILPCLRSDLNLEKKLEKTVLKIFGVEMKTSAFIGTCTKPGRNWTSFWLNVNTTVMVTIIIMCGFYCAYHVKRKLKESSISGRTKALQQRLSNMLLAQVK